MKFKILIIGEAKTDHTNLQELDLIDCQDIFSEYFDSNASYADAVSGGYMNFEYGNGKLWTKTRYESSRELTEEEMIQLMDYTQGQWSDGIGEGFEQEPVCIIHGVDVYISPWFSGQRIAYSQEEI